MIQQCVLNYDHYCPWMYNSIGYSNYRYFILFLFYFVVTCWYILILLFKILVYYKKLHIFNQQLESTHNNMSIISLILKYITFNISEDALVNNEIKDKTSSFKVSIEFYLVFAIIMSMCISVTLFFLWHVYLCLTNQTTLEFFTNLSLMNLAKEEKFKFINHYDKGWNKNLNRIFGNVPWYYNFIPLFNEYYNNDNDNDDDKNKRKERNDNGINTIIGFEDMTLYHNNMNDKFINIM